MTELETALAQIWCDVLGVHDVGVDDDFFGLGGHSLLAVALAARITELVGVEFLVRDVEDNPTIATQAHAIASALAASVTGPS